jgi:hypothetical protein
MRLTHNPRSRGVAPSEPVIYNSILLSGSNSVVECDLAKVEVAGSNPVSRSRFSFPARSFLMNGLL